MSNDLEKRREHLRAVTEFAGKTGPIWIEQLEPELSTFPKGTFIVVNCVTGEYVTGATLSEATEKFEQRFGRTVGYVHEIGGGFFIGGGIA
jgi:hypothetical protein